MIKLSIKTELIRLMAIGVIISDQNEFVNLYFTRARPEILGEVRLKENLIFLKQCHFPKKLFFHQ